jgi:hypothetical protein
MPDDVSKDPDAGAAVPAVSAVSAAAAAERDDSPGTGVPEGEPAGDRSDRGITDFVRRAVSAGVGAAARSKDDLMRAAAGEVRVWLDHLNLDDEIARVLSKMVIEVKTEIRFRPSEDGKLVPETTNDYKVKGSR